MTSYGSVPIDYSLNQRRLPRSQVERIPTVDDWEDDDGSGRDDADGGDGEHDVGSLASSLRANFLPPSARLLPATDPAFERYKSMGSPSPGSSFLSPVFSHLPSVKPSRLTVASDDAQRLRRKLLRGANLLVIQGGYSGKRFIYERLKELGVAVTIMDGPDTVWRAAAEEGVIAEFIEIDFTEHDTVFQRAMDILLSLELSFDGVTTFYEEAGTCCWEGRRVGDVHWCWCARGEVAACEAEVLALQAPAWLRYWPGETALVGLPRGGLLRSAKPQAVSGEGLVVPSSDLLCLTLLLCASVLFLPCCSLGYGPVSTPLRLWNGIRLLTRCSFAFRLFSPVQSRSPPAWRRRWAWRPTPFLPATRRATSASRGK